MRQKSDASDLIYPDLSALDGETRRQVEGMIEAEKRALLAPRADDDEEECECKEGMFPSNPSGRRSFLLGAAATATAAGALPKIARADAPPGAIEYPVQADPTKEQGRLTNDDGGYGTRSQFESEVRWRFPTATAESSWTMTPLDKSQGIVTPSGLHFERHHGGIPAIDPANFSLIVHGMVDGPKKYTMADLMRFPSISRFLFY